MANWKPVYAKNWVQNFPHSRKISFSRLALRVFLLAIKPLSLKLCLSYCRVSGGVAGKEDAHRESLLTIGAQTVDILQHNHQQTPLPLPQQQQQQEEQTVLTELTTVVRPIPIQQPVTPPPPPRPVRVSTFRILWSLAFKCRQLVKWVFSFQAMASSDAQMYQM